MNTHSGLDFLTNVWRVDVSLILSADTDISGMPGVTIARDSDRATNPDSSKNSNDGIQTLQEKPNDNSYKPALETL